MPGSMCAAVAGSVALPAHPARLCNAWQPEQSAWTSRSAATSAGGIWLSTKPSLAWLLTAPDVASRFTEEAIHEAGVFLNWESMGDAGLVYDADRPTRLEWRQGRRRRAQAEPIEAVK